MKYDIKYVQENCSGCLRCQLACSRVYERHFQPSMARLKIKYQQTEFQVNFTEDCISCGFCSDSCLFGALEKSAREKMV